MKFFEPSLSPAEGLGVLLLFQLIEEAVPAFFRPDRTIHIARAPGQLDVMGGFADYSGSLVLQMPLAEAACAAVQLRDDDLLRLWSPCRDGSRTQVLSMSLADLGLPDAAIEHAEARALFGADARDRWAGYLLGCLLVLARERGLSPRCGFDLLLHSDVPEGRGVGSSAAIEVAAMRALAEVYEVALTGRELALLCQVVENEIAGAPGSAAGQATAASAEAEELLALRCQPCEIEGSIIVPHELEFVAIDSVVRPVAADPRSVRTGTFLGQRILADRRGLPARREGELVLCEDPEWHGYLANCRVDEFRSRWRGALPETIDGAEFLQRYGGQADPHSHVEPARTYAVREPTQHPVEQNARTERFRDLLSQAPLRHRELGELMFESHAAYATCGLGNTMADFVVERARRRMTQGGQVFGAKLTGRGGGSTVVLLGERGKVWYEALRIKKALLQETGDSAHIFRWSSPGAMSFGSIELRPLHA
ncbi:MAG TPA: GHMP kinase [Planctomycetota bacterium]|nr:GHMP kinase [Planctomycetota bacterium]